MSVVEIALFIDGNHISSKLSPLFIHHLSVTTRKNIQNYNLNSLVCSKIQSSHTLSSSKSLHTSNQLFKAFICHLNVNFQWPLTTSITVSHSQLHEFRYDNLPIEIHTHFTTSHPRGQLYSRDGLQSAIHRHLRALVASDGCGYSYSPSRSQQVVSLLIPVSIAIGGELIKHEHTIWSGYVSMQFNVIISNCCPPSTATTAAVARSTLYNNDRS